jgi:hypothetical protein
MGALNVIDALWPAVTALILNVLLFAVCPRFTRENRKPKKISIALPKAKRRRLRKPCEQSKELSSGEMVSAKSGDHRPSQLTHRCVR